jgi:hypothetical protein
MNTMVITHGCYILIGVAATAWVSWTLQRRGQAFLVRWLGGDQLLAASWNHLLAVGVYLLHVGALLLALRYGGHASTQIEAIELLSTKIGLVLLALAVTHFLHIKAYWRLYRSLPKIQPPIVDATIVPEVVAQ